MTHAPAHILIDEHDNPVPLPFNTTYLTHDGQPRPCSVHGISAAPRPNHSLKVMRRGSLEVWVSGKPYYGWDPETLNLRIVEAQS